MTKKEKKKIVQLIAKDGKLYRMFNDGSWDSYSGEKEKKIKIGFDKKTRHYQFLIDKERGIHGVIACFGCMPSRRPCLIHDK